jgi:hypothetical protein
VTYYCTFFVNSNDAQAASRILSSEILETIECDDLRSPERLASVERLRAAGFLRRADLPRYAWAFDSEHAIGPEELDPYPHVEWLLSRLKPGTSLAAERAAGTETHLGFFWGGRGTGGGPFISVQLAELLVRHQIALDVGFYYQDSEEEGVNAT